MLERIEQAKRHSEALIAELSELRQALAAYLQERGLDQIYRDTRQLDDDELDEDGREVGSPEYVADRMMVDAFNVSAKLDALAAAIALVEPRSRAEGR